MLFVFHPALQLIAKIRLEALGLSGADVLLIQVTLDVWPVDGSWSWKDSSNADNWRGRADPSGCISAYYPDSLPVSAVIARSSKRCLRLHRSARSIACCSGHWTGAAAKDRSYTESWLDSLGPFKDVVLSLLATLAKQERVRLSERVMAGLARARKEGRIGGRPKRVVSTSKMRKLADQGLSAVKIGAQLGCSRMTVARRLAEFA